MITCSSHEPSLLFSYLEVLYFTEVSVFFEIVYLYKMYWRRDSALRAATSQGSNQTSTANTPGTRDCVCYSRVVETGNSDQMMELAWT